MAQINVSGLTFCYEGSYDNIFENASFSVDTNWKLGLIGRNGKGKTTFLNLLLGKYEYEGSISAPSFFDYFPFEIREKDMDRDTIDVIETVCPGTELWRICTELAGLETDAGLLYRPYSSLSHGERTKVMLAVLFSRENYFLLIDEPTNHLDMPTREAVRDYLNKKKGFILVSHDRWLLDGCVDHVLVLERNQIQVEKGNFTSWWENKQKRDAFEFSENEKLKGEVRKLEEASKRTAAWAARVEKTKIGFNPVKEPDRSKDTRAYIGEKSKRMQQRRKNLERRQQSAIEQKSRLLKNLEQPGELKLIPLSHYKEIYVKAEDASFCYGGREVLGRFNMELRRGSRTILQGRNGCGKTSVIKAILTAEGAEILNPLPNEIKEGIPEIRGRLEVARGLKISWISQDTSFLKGSLDDYIEKSGVGASMFKAVLRQLDFERVQFEKPMEKFSEGQKKKVLIAGSLLQQAHLYIWDEPLNYIDIFSRMQIEELIMKYNPTMLIVEHDRFFGERCAHQKILL
ncbi:ribosomal protection-like ABC-F family protein [Murimonas intestini]|uniref:Lincosamide and streptogramin A transport system ATP-binding/permease protein n=1 Tax=Murimonas intestini TaxID=1337051 RepID=A0AB73SXQ0_9FIRM|nr:ATP-binding cassette domain-containing protein [Murimonas intestini]MCR1843372.1 ATP-binding cassette domain-containing protein [Murimonas intestini]MCR1868706.1 ATP-binding cassette domain-containing protein [Murimonas intestini]MCR1886346.1 ATP-binding cassette domain-containing protein [Murimonas intestini]